ncbi:MAG: amino acid synthesis family protein [Trinickia sp.]|uniref:amino acid synthesis family protein n=1 Tax=Trinickia sp. TaxID=2571163 RepID=UPI003F7ED322
MFEIRRVLTHVEDIFHEFGPAPARPQRRGAIAAVLGNPFAGRYEREIQHAMDALKPIGLDMAQRLLAAMAVPHGAIESYGKGAIVGAAGELEHGALWHVPGGYAMRELLEKHGVPTNAIVPSTKKVGPPSAMLDVPLTHVNASYVRSHFDAIEVRVPGAPAADELVYILAMSTGQRVHARVGGLAKEAIVGKDGLR